MKNTNTLTEAVKHNVSLVIPCYRSPITLGELINRTSVEMEKSNYVGDYEIIIVNDGSPDDLQSVIESIANTIPKVRWIQLTRNFGQHTATLVGCREARYELVLTMDDDGQHKPESLMMLIEELGSDIDVVYGVPTNLPHSRFRNYSSAFLKSVVFSLLGIKNAKRISSLRLFRRKLVSGYLSDANFTDAVVDVVIDWTTTKKGFVSVEMEAVRDGQSRYDLKRLTRLALQMLTSLSSRPLRFATLSGLLISMISMVIGISFIVLYLLGQVQVPGFASLAVLVTFLGAFQLMFLGLLGEYVMTLKDRAVGKPTYVIRGQSW